MSVHSSGHFFCLHFRLFESSTNGTHSSCFVCKRPLAELLHCRRPAIAGVLCGRDSISIRCSTLEFPLPARPHVHFVAARECSLRADVRFSCSRIESSPRLSCGVKWFRIRMDIGRAERWARSSGKFSFQLPVARVNSLTTQSFHSLQMIPAIWHQLFASARSSRSSLIVLHIQSIRCSLLLEKCGLSFRLRFFIRPVADRSVDSIGDGLSEEQAFQSHEEDFVHGVRNHVSFAFLFVSAIHLLCFRPVYSMSCTLERTPSRPH